MSPIAKLPAVDFKFTLMYFEVFIMEENKSFELEMTSDGYASNLLEIMRWAYFLSYVSFMQVWIRCLACLR